MIPSIKIQEFQKQCNDSRKETDDYLMISSTGGKTVKKIFEVCRTSLKRHVFFCTDLTFKTALLLIIISHVTLYSEFKLFYLSSK